MIKARNFLFFVFILFYTLYPIPYTLSYAETVTSTELIEKAKEFDGKTVMYKGEVITDIFNRGEYSWANLSDGANAIGIWCESSKLNAVKFIGKYKQKGDILEVSGIFNRACPLHGGELDIHAKTLRIVKQGFLSIEGIDKNRIKISIGLFLLTFLIIIIFRKRI